jgi:hypothetical protein
MALIERRIEGDKITCLYKSTNVLLTEYHTSMHTLEVTFRNGMKYVYHAVTPMEHAGLQIAESTGQYFAKTIKPKRFEKIGATIVTEWLRKADGNVIG